MASDTLQVVIADDDDEVRAALRELLHGAGDIEAVAEAATAQEAIAACAADDPQVAVLDVRMPGDGLSAAREITASNPGTRVVTLTASDATGDARPRLVQRSEPRTWSSPRARTWWQ